MSRLVFGLTFGMVVGSVGPIMGQDIKGIQSIGPKTDPEKFQELKTRAGYEDVPQFGGENSVPGQLKSDDIQKVTLFRFDYLQRFLKPYFHFKKRLNDEYGFAFGTDYTVLYQTANESPGKDEAASGIFRVFGSWTAFGRDSGYQGNLVYKVENRRSLGTGIAPQGLGLQAGYTNLTAGPFSNFDWGLTNLYWQQQFAYPRLNVIAGVVDTTDYVNLYSLINPWTAFSNLAFLTDPTIPAPNQGLGAAVGSMLTEQIYVVAGFADANGDATRPGFDTFFDDAEYFKHVEMGWTPSLDRRYLDNLHITLWQVDERTLGRVSDGWGVAFSGAWFVDDRWMPFLRGGYAKDGGAVYDHSLSAGLGYYLVSRADLLGFGFNWGHPSDTTYAPGLSDEYTTELFYRLQFSQNFALTPDVQLLFNPALNPNDDVIAVFGIRARLAL